MPAATFSTVSPISIGAMPAAASTTSGRFQAGGGRGASSAVAVGRRWGTSRCAKARTQHATKVEHRPAGGVEGGGTAARRRTQSAEHVAARVLERLALLLRHQLGQVVLRRGREMG